jgi:hypothetical protein
VAVGVGGSDVAVGGTGDGGTSVGAGVSSAAHAPRTTMSNRSAKKLNTDLQNAELFLDLLSVFSIDILLLLFLDLQLAELEGKHQGDGNVQ